MKIVFSEFNFEGQHSMVYYVFNNYIHHSLHAKSILFCFNRYTFRL